jgi:cytoskeletal protein CcmA (bactofilin family)
MINFSRRDRIAETSDGLKAALTAASYGGTPAPTKTTAATLAATTTANSQPGVTARPLPPRAPTTRDAMPMPAPVTAPRDNTPPTHAGSTPAAAPNSAGSAGTADSQGSKLFIGVNILLKGVEISNCDILVIEGNVEATVNSKTMEIAKPGTLKGTALIDVAEIHGDFAGDLTARARLVVHGTGRVSGTIRYGKLIVAEGGELSGDVKCLDDATRPSKASSSRDSSADAHPLLSS